MSKARGCLRDGDEAANYMGVKCHLTGFSGTFEAVRAIAWSYVSEALLFFAVYCIKQPDICTVYRLLSDEN